MAFISTDRCLPNLKPGEPFFIFRASDRLAPYFVRAWAHEARDCGLSRDRYEDALRQAQDMENWPDRVYLRELYEQHEIPANEHIFTLRGQDVLAADILRSWCERASHYGLQLAHCQRVNDIVHAMRNWPNQRYPD